MAYCTLSDLTAVVQEADIIQLTDDAGSGAVDQTKVDAAIESADDLIDGYLRGRYTLPLDETPKVVRRISVDLTLFYLHERRFKLAMPESIQKSYDNCIRLLGQIQTGKLSLGVDSGTSTGSGEFKTNKTADDRAFPKDTMDQY